MGLDQITYYVLGSFFGLFSFFWLFGFFQLFVGLILGFLSCSLLVVVGFMWLTTKREGREGNPVEFNLSKESETSQHKFPTSNTPEGNNTEEVNSMTN